jgi:3-oxoacyl-[acyl-carrier protein] reductase
MNKVVIITGTRKGLGRDIANYFLENGDFVYGCSRRAPSIEHSNYRHHVLDISNETDVIGFVKAVYKERGKIDILLNNAGAASMNHFLLTPYETAKKLINTNFFGTFLMCRETAKFMIRQKYGRIVNYTTVAVPLHLEGELVYSSSKAAVEQLTKVLAAEIGHLGVTVNAIGPTPIETDLIKNVPKVKIQELIDRQSIKRLGELRDVLNVIRFLVSDDSDYITGQVIYLGGIN